MEIVSARRLPQPLYSTKCNIFPMGDSRASQAPGMCNISGFCRENRMAFTAYHFGSQNSSKAYNVELSFVLVY